MGRLGIAATLAGLIIAPLFLNSFMLVQVVAQSAILGLIALSLMLLGGWGGIVSLSQMTVAGLAGYTLAIIGTSSVSQSWGWPALGAVPLALACATLAGVLFGLAAGRTRGVYTIMITLAIGVAVYYFANQNYSIFNGFTGYSGITTPQPFGFDLRAPVPFYALCVTLAFAGWSLVTLLGRSSFGLAFLATRDNERRVAATGYDVVRLRLAAHGIAGLLAGLGGVLLVWLNGRISPGTIGVGPMIDILIIAVIGGLGRPIGPFIGAAVYLLLKTFAIDMVDPERFNTLIGAVFLIIVLLSQDGLIGLARRTKAPGQI
jgi:branched-chain amino acid transport system permease protein